MSRVPFLLSLLVLSLCGLALDHSGAAPLFAQEEVPAEPPEVDAAAADRPVARQVKSAEVLAQEARDSVAVITVAGRDGKKQGLGTGFVLDASGLIATNLHVIGEARPIAVEFADGTKYDVQEVYASDRNRDLAIVRIDAQNLKPFELGDSSSLKQGQPIVVLGNPHGLRHSVVSGVLSGRRKVDERDMLQLAIPIEPGNSGGPVLDSAGRVQGIVTMKSIVTDNLGFAVPINQLKPLAEKPNPVPMSRWLTIGALDEREWKPLFGARWQQRAGRIYAAQPGDGFGGRSLCLWQEPVPATPTEIGVWVKLEDESGAAGLVFHSDGKHRHYGFYPSAGKLRLTRFTGPSVYSWTVLHNEPSEHYKPGEWNYLKVRLEEHEFRCFVNDELVITSRDSQLPPGKAGLAKFRDTVAQFKKFRIGDDLSPSRVDPELAEQLLAHVDELASLDDLRPKELAPLAEHSASSAQVLREKAKRLQREAELLKQLAADVHVQAVVEKLAQVVDRADDADIDLARATLLIARLDEEEVDVDEYIKQIDRMAREIEQKLDGRSDEAGKLAALNEYLFEDNGFHGSRTDYYHRANSHLSSVIDDREGLPITLAVLYMELGRRIGLNLEGVGLPGHFVVRFIPGEGEPQLIDVFERGEALSREDAERKVLNLSGAPLEPEHLEATSQRAIVLRVLNNLLGIAERSGEMASVLRYLEAKVAIDPESIADRGKRAIARFQTGRHKAAIDDLDWFLNEQPAGLDLDRIEQMRQYFLKRAHGQ